MDTYNKVPLVSVRLMTYNHEKFIRDAMDSIMDQKVNFLVEVVVGDDFSTDDTLKIISEYKSSNNIKIKILNRVKGDEYWQTRQTKGRLYNFINILENCNGKYIALLDGDDYWTDPLKLQKQVDFLEEHDDCPACFTNARIINEIENSERDFLSRDEGFVSQKDVILTGGGLYPTASILFRNEKLNLKVFAEIGELAGDDLLIKSLSMTGKVYYLAEVTCVYRRWGGGVYSSIATNKEKLIEYKKKNIEGLIKLNKIATYPVNKYIKMKISKEAFYILTKGKFLRELSYIKFLSIKDFVRVVFKLIKK